MLLQLQCSDWKESRQESLGVRTYPLVFVEIVGRTDHCPCLHHARLLAEWRSDATIIFAMGSGEAKDIHYYVAM